MDSNGGARLSISMHCSERLLTSPGVSVQGEDFLSGQRGVGFGFFRLGWIVDGVGVGWSSHRIDTCMDSELKDVSETQTALQTPWIS